MDNTNQDYFWASDWQEDEHQADEDIKAGRVKTFSTAEALITDLSSEEEYVWSNSG